MKVQVAERYVGFNQHVLTQKEAKELCVHLPQQGHEKLIFSPEDNCHFWIGKRSFRNNHNFIPIPDKLPWCATKTNWRLINGQAILSSVSA